MGFLTFIAPFFMLAMISFDHDCQKQKEKEFERKLNRTELKAKDGEYHFYKRGTDIEADWHDFV